MGGGGTGLALALLCLCLVAISSSEVGSGRRRSGRSLSSPGGDDKDLRAELATKKRRLRRLRAEVAALSESLQSARPKGARKRSWRRQVVGELRRLRKELRGGAKKKRKRAQKLHRRGGGGRKRRQKAERKRRARRRRAKKKRRLAKSLAAAERRQQELAYKLSSLETARNASRRGWEGGACAAQSDCRPGLCCVSQTAEAAAGRCRALSVAKGGSCQASCQCSPPLSCFQPSAASEEARCKEASADDALRGHYLDPTLPLPL